MYNKSFLPECDSIVLGFKRNPLTVNEMFACDLRIGLIMILYTKFRLHSSQLFLLAKSDMHLNLRVPSYKDEVGYLVRGGSIRLRHLRPS